MAIAKPRIVIIGAGMAGLTAANTLYQSTLSKQLFEISVVEGGSRVGGRIKSSEFCGDRIEQGATWIHGIQGSPIYKIAKESKLLNSQQPWEGMDEWDQDPVTVAEGGHVLNPSIVEPISRFFDNLIDLTRGKGKGKAVDEEDSVYAEMVKKHSSRNFGPGKLSVGSFLRQGYKAYRGLLEDPKGEVGTGNWMMEELEEAIFAMHENTHRVVSAVDDLESLDFDAEKEYTEFPGEDITIARGYSSVIESLASGLPIGMIQLYQKVEKIDWQPNMKNGDESRPVKLHFADGSTISADHVIVTVSLGVLKRGISEDYGLFDPPLPDFKIDAITRLGYGVVDKVFLQLSHDQESNDFEFPFLQMIFHQSHSELRSTEIPQWIRRTPLLYPIYRNSRVVVSLFTGQEALEVEALSEEEIIEGFSATVSNLLSSKSNHQMKPNCNKSCHDEKNFKFVKVLRTHWGIDPLFLGSYSYVAVGSSGVDIDTLAEPLPQNSKVNNSQQLQILFAGEATHRTHYSTTHGAYLSGLREAQQILKHYGL